MFRKTAVPVMAAAAVLAGLAGVALSQSWNSKTYTDRARDSAGTASASAAAAASPEVPPPAAPPAGASGAAPSSTTLPPGMSTAAVTAQAEEKVAEMKSAEEESWSEEEGIGYDPKGRRDPFKPLVGSSQMDTGDERGKLPGIAGISVREVKLIGIAVDEEQKVAIFFGGPDQEGYFVREGQSFYDGTVNKIDPDARMVIIRTKIDDPRSLVKYRDTPIQLHPTEEAAKP